MVFLALVSVPLWIIFEEYNKHTLPNWHYIGLPETLLVRYVGYVWAFATIWPAILITAELVGAIRDRRAPALPPPRSRARSRSTRWPGSSMVAGAIMLLAADRLSVAVAGRAGLARLHLPARSDQRAARRRVAARRSARAASRAPGQPAGRGPGLRAALGVLELLGAHQVGLHRAGAARHQAVRDAAGRLPRVSRPSRSSAS